MDARLEAQMRFRFGSGRLCFAFTGTLGERGTPTPLERLATPAGLERWSAEAGLSSDARASARDLVDARELREAIYRVADALRTGAQPGLRERGLVNSWCARPALAPQIASDGTLSWRGGTTAREILATVAQDAVTVLVEHGERLRVCANPDCLGLFVDLSRPGSRRWCSMATCGNQAKKAAYRARRRAARA